jgi:ubiquinone/menaquinone biosynthesis C-methylase UbiE
MSKSDYILSGPKEKERLQLQARLWQPKAEVLLDEIGIQPGWRCLDVGCGAMGILGPLSRRVGSGGKVVGIDKDPALLAAARAYVADEGLTNVEIVEADARHTELPRESFDFVHARFILVFGQADQILKEMLALTCSGGLIAAQETDQRGWHF